MYNVLKGYRIACLQIICYNQSYWLGKKETHNFVYDLMKLGIVNLNLKRIENTNKQIWTKGLNAQRTLIVERLNIIFSTLGQCSLQPLSIHNQD